MRETCFLALAFILLFTQGVSAGSNKNVDWIPWDENAQIVWDDFQGPPDPNDAEVAYTGGLIEVHTSCQNNALRATIRALFDKKKSWVKTAGGSNLLLNHEQIHFDIMELHARKIRKAITEFRGSCSESYELERYCQVNPFQVLAWTFVSL